MVFIAYMKLIHDTNSEFIYGDACQKPRFVAVRMGKASFFGVILAAKKNFIDSHSVTKKKLAFYCISCLYAQSFGDDRTYSRKAKCAECSRNLYSESQDDHTQSSMKTLLLLHIGTRTSRESMWTIYGASCTERESVDRERGLVYISFKN